MRNAVDIGIKYEKKVLEALQTYGLKAYRTNQTNIHDPKGYKHGFDGGVDIIAEFHTSIKGGRDFTYNASAITETLSRLRFQKFMQVCMSEKVLGVPAYL